MRIFNPKQCALRQHEENQKEMAMKSRETHARKLRKIDNKNTLKRRLEYFPACRCLVLTYRQASTYVRTSSTDVAYRVMVIFSPNSHTNVAPQLIDYTYLCSATVRVLFLQQIYCGPLSNEGSSDVFRRMYSPKPISFFRIVRSLNGY